MQQLARLSKISGGKNRYVALLALASQQSQNFSLNLVTIVGDYLHVPKAFLQLSKLAIENITACTNISSQSALQIHNLLKQMDGYRRNDRSKQIISAMRAIDAVLQLNITTNLDFLDWLLPRLIDIKLSEAKMQNQNGKAIADAIDKQRCAAIEDLRSQYVKQT